MSREQGYTLVIENGKDGVNTEAIVIKALTDKHILKWAYIVRDKEYYTQKDMDIRRLELQRVWVEGFPNQDRYSSADEYVEEKLGEPPHIGDKKKTFWKVVCITDEECTASDIAILFGVSVNAVRSLSDSLYMSQELRQLDGNYEIKSNFDYQSYMASIDKKAQWLMVRRSLNLANIVTFAIFIFIVVVIVKFGIDQAKNHPWLVPGILWAIGLMYLVINLLVIRASKKNNRHISGIPFVGGVHILIAGLICPCKWLALLCLLDYSIWSFLHALR